MRRRRKILKPRFRNAPQAKNFETPILKCAAGENFETAETQNAPQAKIFETPRRKNAPQAKNFKTPHPKNWKFPILKGGFNIDSLVLLL